MKDLDRRIRQGGDDAIAAVSELMPRWIPVEERLPEPDIDVLVFGGRRCGVAQFAWVDASDIGGQEWNGTAIVPTHWMPLPEPPGVTP